MRVKDKKCSPLPTTDRKPFRPEHTVGLCRAGRESVAQVCGKVGKEQVTVAILLRRLPPE